MQNSPLKKDKEIATTPVTEVVQPPVAIASVPISIEPLLKLEKKARKALEEDIMNEILEDVVSDLSNKLAARTLQEFKKQIAKEQEQLELQAKAEEEAKLLELLAVQKEKKLQERKEKREYKKQQMDLLAEDMVELLIAEECDLLVNNLLIQEKDSILVLLSSNTSSTTPTTNNTNATEISPPKEPPAYMNQQGTITPNTYSYPMNTHSPTKGYRMPTHPASMQLPPSVAPMNVAYTSPMYSVPITRSWTRMPSYSTPNPTANAINYVPAYSPVATYYYPNPTMVSMSPASPMVYAPTSVIPNPSVSPPSPTLPTDAKTVPSPLPTTTPTATPTANNNNTTGTIPSATTIRSSPENYGFTSALTVVCSNLPETTKKGDITTLFNDSTIALNLDYTTKVYIYTSLLLCINSIFRYNFCMDMMWVLAL
jgi:Sec-independent protein translocase protein TatA